jgi:hypothetical protein
MPAVIGRTYGPPNKPDRLAIPISNLLPGGPVMHKTTPLRADRHLTSRQIYKERRSEALSEWRAVMN